MPTFIEKPTQIEACGTPPKIIKEHIGRVNSDTQALSIAHMKSPSGWAEPGQRPDFDEYTIVLGGELQVDTEDGESRTLGAGEAMIARAGEWVRYSTPGADGADYIAVCLPAFAMETVHRDAD